MFDKIKKINVTKIQPLKHCGKDIGFLFDVSYYMPPFSIEAFNNENHNLKSCNNCKKLYDIILNQLKDSFTNFPNCCDNHKNLLQDPNFVYSDYIEFYKTVATKTFYTFHHILNHLDKDNWFSEYINYTEYVLHSFGQYPNNCGNPIGLGHFFHYLEFLLKNFIQISKLNDDHKIKLESIIFHLDELKKPSKLEKDNNLSSLSEIYSKWYEAFPFELKFFSDLGNIFGNTLPYLTKNWEHNPYLKVYRNKLIGTAELINYLDKITDNILDSVDTTELLEDEYIKSGEKYRLDLKKKDHKITQKINLKKYFANGQPYLKTITNWLKAEKEFLNDVFFETQLSDKKLNIKKGYDLCDIDIYDERFSNFHDSLRKNLFIQDSLTDFRKSFTGDHDKKIKWLKDQNELNYLITNIKSILIKDYGAWKCTKDIFVAEDGSPLNKHFRSNTYKEKHEILDKIVSNLK
jgi:hypothetical protein